MRTWMLLLLSISVVVVLVACSRPEPPTITPERVEFVESDPSGFIARVHCKAHNPNSFAIPVTSVRGAIRFEQSDTARVTASSAATLAPNADTSVAFDVKSDWSTVAGTVGHARAGTMVNYTTSGTASLDVNGTSLDVPFTITGQIEKKAIALAALRHLGLPKNQPGMVGGKLPPAVSTSSSCE